MDDAAFAHARTAELRQASIGLSETVIATDGTLEIRTSRTSELDEAARSAVIRLCIDAHQEEDFRNLFSYLPPDGLHVLGYLREQLVGHAVVTTRWLQQEGLRLLRTAYVDAVATSPAQQGQGIGSAVMSHLASVVGTTTSPAWTRSTWRSTSAWAGRSGAGRWRDGRATA